MVRIYTKIKELIEKSHNILIVSHKKPDADTLGAAISLKIWIKSLFKRATLYCVDKPSATFDFIPGIDEFVKKINLEEFDLVLMVDIGAKNLIGADFDFSNKTVVNIDHHASNDMFGDTNLVDPKAASATVIIYRIFKHFDVEITEDVATSLLAGIYGDTGSFMHSNTSKEVFQIASELLAKGAKIAAVGKALFRMKSVSALRLWGKVLENTQLTKENVVVSVVKEDFYDSVNANPEQLSGIVDYLSMVPGSRYAILLNEDRKGNVKGSLRTRKDDVDVAKIASEFGGGGHSKASGFVIPGKIAEESHFTIVSLDAKKSLDF